MASMESTTQSEAINICNLDYDCLREIFKYLKIEEAFAMIGIFNTVIDDVARDRIKETKELTVAMRYAPNLPLGLIELIGHNLEAFRIDAGFSLPEADIIKYLESFCKATKGRNLTKLTIHYIRFSQNYLDCILPLAPQIKELDVSHCVLNDHFLFELTKAFTNLRSCNITGNWDLTETAILDAFTGTENKCEFITDLGKSVIFEPGIGVIL